MTSEASVDGTIRVERRDGRPWLVLLGEVDVHTVDGVTDATLAELADATEVDVDLAAVTFMDSLGLAFLVRVHDLVGTLRLHDVPEGMARLLHMTGLAERFEPSDG